MPLAIQFFDVIVAVHVMCVVAAFGVTFAYPVVIPWLRATHPSAMPTVHATQARIGRRLIGPVSTLVLLTGIYLATDRNLWDQAWVTVPFVIIIILFGLAGAFFTPRDRRLAELAERDLGADRGGTLGGEYDALLRQTAIVGLLYPLLVLIAIFFMVAKPFAG